ncbi:hypothetical protein [Acidovorax cavernicola]|nr:hypothetical protein [Acidovorax cavernicola]
MHDVDQNVNYCQPVARGARILGAAEGGPPRRNPCAIEMNSQTFTRFPADLLHGLRAAARAAIRVGAVGAVMTVGTATAPSAAAQILESAPQVHVVVALVDNASQGIVPVPAAIGNGDDAASNLYWGAAYGLKTFLSKAPGWRRTGCQSDVTDSILERCEFVWGKDKLRLTAEAWRGRHIDRAMQAFMTQAATPPKTANRRELVMFVGHDGLMDAVHANLPAQFPRGTPHGKKAAVLACLSDRFFSKHLLAAGATPVVTTFSLMAPEGYVVEAVARTFAGSDSQADEKALRRAAGDAYAKYQKLKPRAGRRVFGTD